MFKYLLDIEPEEAPKHPRFEMVLNAFEQQRRKGICEFIREYHLDVDQPPELLEPLEPEMTSERFVELPPPSLDMNHPRHLPREGGH